MLSDEIINARRGNITASEAHNIMAGWDVPAPKVNYPEPIYNWIAQNGVKPLVGAIKDEMECDVSSKAIEAAWKVWQHKKTPQGLITYAERLACDELFETDPSLFDGANNVHMENGREREDEAVAMLIESTGLPFTKIGEDQIHISVDGVGVTPDGIVYDELDLITTGCEVKCRSPLHHARQLLIEDNESLAEHDFARYCQIQVACHVTGADHWYSVSFNPFAKRDEYKFHYCVIHREDWFLDIFKERAALVFKHKALFLESLNERVAA